MTASLRLAPLGLLLSLACSNALEVEPGETVTLAPGQTVRLEGYDVTVTFVAVPQDSRCPVNDFVQCVWIGDATVTIHVTGAAGQADLEVHTHPDFGREATYAGFRIALEDLTPIPTGGGPPPAAAYRLRLRIGSMLD